MTAPGTEPPRGGGWVPIPDPTILTTAAVAQAADQFRRELAALREILETRLDAMDTQRRIMLQIIDERSAQVQEQFRERDLRFSERDQARTDAVTAALAAAKELSDSRDACTDKATGKFEETVHAQIDQLGVLGQSGRDQLATQIQALKERIDRGEGSAAGERTRRVEQRLDLGQLVAVVAVIVAIVTAILYALKK